MMQNHLQASYDLDWLHIIRFCCVGANDAAKVLRWIQARPLKGMYQTIGSMCAGMPVVCRDSKAGAGNDAVAGGGHRRCYWRNWRHFVLLLLLPLLVRAEFRCRLMKIHRSYVAGAPHWYCSRPALWPA